MKKLLLALSCAAALAVAFVIGRLSAPGALPPPETSGPSPSRGGEHSPALESGPPAIAAESVEAELAADPELAAQIEARESLLTETASAGSPFARTQRLFQQVQETPLDEIPALITRFENCPDLRVRNEVQGLLIGRWAEADPRAALAWQQAHPSPAVTYMDTKLTTIFGIWGETNPQAAIDAAKVLPQRGGARYSALLAVMYGIRENDSQLALQLLKSNPDAFNSDWGYSDVFAAMAVRDGPGAYRQALALEDDSQRNSALTGVFASWAQADPQGALAGALACENLSMRHLAVNQVLQQMANTDPVAALNVYYGLEEKDRDAWGAVELYGAWAGSDPQAALDHAMEHMESFSERQSVVTNVLNQWFHPGSGRHDRLPGPLAGLVHKNRYLAAARFGSGFTRQAGDGL